MVETKKKQMEEKPIYQRLHNIHQEKMQKHVQKVMQQTLEMKEKGRNNQGMMRNKSEANFQSAKSRERDGRPIEDLLY